MPLGTFKLRWPSVFGDLPPHIAYDAVTDIWTDLHLYDATQNLAHRYAEPDPTGMR